jgi:hypothetical protein
VVEAGGELIAHAGIVPGAYLDPGRRVTTLHLIDWAARAGSGAGVTLLKHLGRMSQALLAIGGGAETLRILPHVGFRPAGVATGYARPLFPLRILRAGANRKLLPRLTRALWRRRSLPRRGSAGWQARPLNAEELGQIAALLPRPSHGVSVMERSAGLFRHALACPSAPMQLYAGEQGGRIRGYFLLASVAGQVRIADCWVDSEQAADWRALILCAVAEARRDPQAAEVVMWASEPLLAGVLRSCGFHARFQSPIQLRPGDTDMMPGGTLRVQMLDNDAAFLWEGRNDYWG